MYTNMNYLVSITSPWTKNLCNILRGGGGGGGGGWGGAQWGNLIGHYDFWVFFAFLCLWPHLGGVNLDLIVNYDLFK